MITFKAPSNIALVKYWGKRKGQLPANPSISFTLTNCYTETSVAYQKLNVPAKDFSFDFYLDNELKPDFRPKIETFFSRIFLETIILRFILTIHFRIVVG